jgi:hypothetical protein
MTKIYRSDVRAAVHEAMSGLHAAGLLDDESMRGFDELCLTQAAATHFAADDRLKQASLRFAMRLTERLRAATALPEGSNGKAPAESSSVMQGRDLSPSGRRWLAEQA